MMAKYLEEREPFTRDELAQFLNGEIEKTYSVECQYGAGWQAAYFKERDTKQAEETLKRFDNGEIVAVKTVSYREDIGGGLCDFSETLFSNGKVSESFYGWSD